MDNIQEKIYKSAVRGLRFILVLSLIGSGFQLLSNFFTALLYPAFKTAFESGEWQKMLPLMSQLSGSSDTTPFEYAMEQMMNVPQAVYFLWVLLYAMSLAGVIMMWRLRRNGLHLYAIAQLLILIVTLLFMGKSHLPVGDVMMTILFIVVYFVNLRRIEQLKPQEQETGDPSNDTTPNE